MKRMVIFDFDGVIVDSWWLAHQTSKKIYPNLTEDEHRAGFEGNIYETERSWTHKRVKEIDYYAEYEKEMHLVKFFQEMEQIIPELAKKYKLAIVSSSKTEVIKTYLRREGLLEYFPDILGADVHESKHEKIHMLFSQHNLSPSHCVMITDTSGDVREASKAGVDSIGVSWGFHDLARLGKVKTFRIVHEPKELESTITEYFAR